MSVLCIPHAGHEQHAANTAEDGLDRMYSICGSLCSRVKGLLPQHPANKVQCLATKTNAPTHLGLPWRLARGLFGTGQWSCLACYDPHPPLPSPVWSPLSVITRCLDVRSWISVNNSGPGALYTWQFAWLAPALVYLLCIISEVLRAPLAFGKGCMAYILNVVAPGRRIRASRMLAVND